MDEVDAILSHDVTEALNVSMPDVVRAAGRGRIASTMILGAAFTAAALGLLAAIISSAFAATFAMFVLIMAVFAIVIGVEVAALIVGVRAKRAFKRIAETVWEERRATVVRVDGRRVHVRA
jgi:hypothetical protein